MNRLAEFMANVARDVYPEPISEGHTAITKEMASVVAKRLMPGARVLDVGCGQGPALEWFTQAGFKSFGITLGQEDYEACAKAGHAVKRCDQNAMPEGWSDCYDCVWARHVLEHSIAPYWTLTEFNRVLKAGGYLYAEMPAPSTSCHHEANANHYSVLGWMMWGSLITRAGFNVIESREINITTPAGPDKYLTFLCQKK